ncbi:helix-turn-helix transcriptional regulator [Paenibacillus sp. p3-SID867]|uniref:ArsR/SmtB family transcription factor n=1 Tax=Paenibacillus sp. p3-SID867 TaxID=2916363 RepID=UPI002882F39D|nr:helix-turn-helix transcriptional regulator [Paenibacillus sp. p3-SID867]
MPEEHSENHIFRALADPSRRLLLDLLFEDDGRTLTELCDYLNMTRHGVMKHLNILEEAGLITTQKNGREKLHYLNPVPITQIHDRWVSKFSKAWTSGLNRLMSRDKNMVPLKVANLAAFLFYRYKFLSRVEDKNLYRLPKRTRT